MLGLALVALLAAPPVEVGLERLEAEHGGALRGKRVGLVAHAASVTRDGRPAVDALRAAGVQVVRLFTPEHGLLGQAGAGEKVQDGVDPRSRLPVVSLYGAKQAPSAEDLRGLDALVFDLQDAGVRFYTYGSTLLLCLEAAGAAGVELVVLDRPNPLGGERVEGPVAERDSFLSRLPGPLVHGLTLGELARLANARRERPARLTVVAMRGWTRAMLWDDTGRAWPTPSPNLRSAEAALVYPGVCLLEATNVSEGRGSEAPFLLFGAPWLEPVKVALEVKGASFEVARFTPRAGPAAAEPKHRDVECAGFRLRVTDPRALSPYDLGLRLLVALQKQPGFAWLNEGRNLSRLLGTQSVYEALRRGDAPEAIVTAERPAVEEWRRAREPHLLY